VAERRRLSQSTLSAREFRSEVIEAPLENLLTLPERAVQFGTGAFLRGFIEYFLDAANRSGAFSGKVVAIGSTGSGRDELVNEQDGLYTLAIEGIERGRTHREFRMISSLSRALSASAEWNEVLALARDPQIELVFSNTTEVGIVLDENDRPGSPPRSFPGKLTMFLLERARAVEYGADGTITVIPCELIEKNGDRLREIVHALADRWSLGNEFLGWLDGNVVFCNTLVDRIVPGKPEPERAAELEEMLGYRDELLTVCEPYRLFAIEAPRDARDRLGFAAADPGVVIADDIEPYRLRKVRLLNGSHSLLAPLALQCGVTTVLDAVGDEDLGEFLRRTMFDELVPACGVSGASEFAADVLDRFSNPYIRHALIDIMLQATAKVRARVVPTIVDYEKREGRTPELTSFGFASFLLFQRGDSLESRRAAGQVIPADDGAQLIRDLWRATDASANSGIARFVDRVCGEQSLWGNDLRTLPGFNEATTIHLSKILQHGVRPALTQLLARSGAGVTQ
jgi:tagaturonate reductase